ncbi:MAG TPA: universal stress protein [Acidimicrobiales bacterium]|nr:universal stress protein [Acidimicrobiales bacterium]
MTRATEAASATGASARGGPVVVGIDGSTSALAALDWAGDYAERTGAPVKLVAAWDWPTSYGWALPLTDDYNPSADAERILTAAASRLLERHAGLSVESETVQGHPAQVLVDASRTATLLVVGSRGHGQFAGMLIGSVSEHCAAQAHCPVLVFHGDAAHGR